MLDDLAEILLTPEEIATEVERLAARLVRDYEGQTPLLVGVLKGSAVFLADLVRALPLPVAVDFISVAGYGAERSTSGVVRIRKDLDENIEGRDVLVVEGIIDTGLTLSYLLRNFRTRQPRSLRVCAFLDKPAQRIIDLQVDYVGRRIPDRFVVGYGLDYRERYRNLPLIGVLKASVLDR